MQLESEHDVSMKQYAHDCHSMVYITISTAGKRWNIQNRARYNAYLQNLPTYEEEAETEEYDDEEEPEDMRDPLALQSYDAREQLLSNAVKDSPQGGGGVAYVRWGHEDCPGAAELVYTGRAAGSHFSHRGGGSNYQCITLKPKNEEFGDGSRGDGFIYGAEYQIEGHVPKSVLDLKLHDHDVPCAVCYVSTRTAKIMVPGTFECPSRWTREYHGYLMTERHNHHRSTFECVDLEAQKAIGGHANRDGALFYFVEPRCGSMPCPPYDQVREMTCAVCTR